MPICDYGCGQEAKHQFKNGKWCCSASWNSCIFKKNKRLGIKRSEETRKKISKSNKGKKLSIYTKNKLREINLGNIVSEETKKKISKKLKGCIPWNKGLEHSRETKKKISISNQGNKTWIKGLKQPEETKKKISKKLKGCIPWNKGLEHSRETKKKISINHKPTIEQIQERYPTFAKIEEMRYEPGKEKEKVIQVHCKNHNCPNSKEHGGWFTPKNNNIIYRRAYAIENNIGSLYMYCSKDCKNECPLFNKKVESIIKQDQIKAGIIKEELYTPSEYQTFREEVLSRSENKCEYCGKKATDVHHSRPQKLEPGFALDPDFGVACCKKCHYEYGHKNECSTGELASKICN